VCDGAGTCVACNVDADCANQTTCDPTHDCRPTPPSCQGLPPTCGPGHDESCCKSNPVTGGSFKRSYDGVKYLDDTYPATVSDFRFDRFLITVGRFRGFVAAWIGGWRPQTGAGKHAHLNGGQGVNGGTEPGWDPAWSAMLASDQGTWDANLSCASGTSTWTANASSNDDLPMNCMDWYEAYAFCIWDGGFLPTEAEWNHAAAGGAEQRAYPWSNPPTSLTIDPSYAVYDCTGDGSPLKQCAFSDIQRVGSRPKGDARWGQADLAGEALEWNLDGYEPFYMMPCNDCAELMQTSERVMRAGGWNNNALFLLVGTRTNVPPANRSQNTGSRCARIP
jgi:formylglycine-generating enzyme required for sulfatase activity